jgi:hypothetical protein
MRLKWSKRSFSKCLFSPVNIGHLFILDKCTVRREAHIHQQWVCTDKTKQHKTLSLPPHIQSRPIHQQSSTTDAPHLRPSLYSTVLFDTVIIYSTHTTGCDGHSGNWKNSKEMNIVWQFQKLRLPQNDIPPIHGQSKHLHLAGYTVLIYMRCQIMQVTELCSIEPILFLSMECALCTGM